jgi:hypothetical protein
MVSIKMTDSWFALKAILSCVQADGAQHTHVTLEEKDSRAKLKKLTITNLTKDMLILATDEGRKRLNPKSPCMSPLLTDGEYDQNRACDAVLLKRSADGYEVCYIELKSDSPSGYEGQFKSTECFMVYVCAILENLCGQRIQVKRKRFIVFHTDSKNASRTGKKRPSRYEPSKANTATTPEKYCVRNQDSVNCQVFF